MPYYTQTVDEDQKKPFTGGSVAGASGGGSGGAPAKAQAPGSGKFVNFDRIFGANQGIAGQMASGVAQNVNNTASGAQSGLQNAQQQFYGDVQAGTTRYGGEQIASPQTPNADGTQTSKSGGLAGGSPQKGGGADSAPPTISREDAAAKASAQYTGPTDFTATQGYQDAYTQGQKAQEQLAATEDVYGVQALLQDQYGKDGGYTSGMSAWDAALTNQAGADQFGKLREKYGNFDTMFANAVTDAGKAVEGGKATTAAQAGLYGGLVNSYDEEQKRAAEAAAAQAAAANQQRLAEQDARANAQREQGDETYSAGDNQRAAMAGGDVYDAWIAAGSPAYDQWYRDTYGKEPPT